MTPLQHLAERISPLPQDRLHASLRGDDVGGTHTAVELDAELPGVRREIFVGTTSREDDIETLQSIGVAAGDDQGYRDRICPGIDAVVHFSIVIAI